MKKTIIGSTQYQKKILELAEELTERGDEVRIPAFDSHPEFTALQICQYNLELIKWAEEVLIYWDCRSPGAWGDFCMAFALGKPVKIMYLENKTMREVVEKYAEYCVSNKQI